MRLLASTTSAGSTNTVLPEADSSCTMPRILRFRPGATGITRRPSRRVGVTSFSTRPSLCAARSMPNSVREMLPSVLASSWRMALNVGDALSFIFPNLSSMVSMARTISGKVVTFSVNFTRDG